MIGFVFVILFALSFSCEGKIILPSDGDELVVAPGEDAKIEWTFDDTGTLISRQWFNQAGEILAEIVGDGDVAIANTSLPGVNVTKPATLILKNVDLRHNQTYKFLLSVSLKSPQSSHVTVFIAMNPNVTIECSTPTTVNKSDDVKCLCKGEGGNPLPSVIWQKNGVKFGATKKEENLLSLINVDGTDSGTYKCVAQSYKTFKDEKTINVTVNFAPEKINVTFSPTKPEFDKKLTITCEASAHPKPNYTIIYNNTETVSSEKMYTIEVVNSSHVGSYQCIAKNFLGNISKTFKLSFDSKASTTMPKPTKASEMTSTASMSATNGKIPVKPTGTIDYDDDDDDDDDDGPSPGLIAGIIIGVLLFLLILVFLLWWFKHRKEKSSGEHIGNDVVPGNQGNAPVPENAYESLADGEGKKPENLYDEARLGNDNGGAGSTSDTLPPVYATVDKEKKKNKKKDKKKNEPAPANTPPVYATVDKTRHNEPSVTYATLDTVAMQPTGSSKRDRRDQPTEYASIAEFGVKGDLV